jgi:hypothetical protein
LPDEKVNIKRALVMLLLLGLQSIFYRRIYPKKKRFTLQKVHNHTKCLEPAVIGATFVLTFESRIAHVLVLTMKKEMTGTNSEWRLLLMTFMQSLMKAVSWVQSVMDPHILTVILPQVTH